MGACRAPFTDCSSRCDESTLAHTGILVHVAPVFMCFAFSIPFKVAG